MSGQAHHWLERIRALPLQGTTRIMNVCGGHERTISMAGLRSLLPGKVELIPGPGCPVCICPEEDVLHAMQIALAGRAIVATFGDMLRVPVNVPRREPRTLEQVSARGGDVRPIASPLEVIEIARKNPEQPVVFFAAGFETTMAPVASLLAMSLPENVTFLLSGRLTRPAVEMLLGSGKPGFDALIAPGHVATIMGTEEWRFVPERHGIPAAVSGFTPESLLASIYSVLRQHLEANAFLDNCYAEVAHPKGNPTALAMLDAAFDVADANWRGIGPISRSGFVLNSLHRSRDARAAFRLEDDLARKRKGDMPAGCDCARVVLGQIYPDRCALYGRACTPGQPVGPCMVSDEGACRIWWASGVREAARSPVVQA